MTKYTGKIIIQWVDKAGKKLRTICDDTSAYLFTRKYLISQGIADADIAVELQASPMFPKNNKTNGGK